MYKLSEIIEREVEVSELGKLYIIKKLVSIFEKKVKLKDLSTIKLEDLQVTNYTESNLDMMSITVLGGKKTNNFETKSNNEEILAWHMTLLILDLMKCKSNNDLLPAWLKEKKQELQGLIESLIENSKTIVNPIYQIAKFVQDILP